jgi:hypothetical protein
VEVPASDREGLARRAEEVLDRNRRGDWTCPSSELYPHQWLWDSCFVAMGLARTDPARAAGELRALLRGQWSNGLVPHMVFAPDVPDVGSRRIWQSTRHPEAPRDVHTSCITQPPLPAVASWRVGQALEPGERHAFLTEVLPKLVAYHRWLYRERDPHGRGLITLIHPWECGLDTTLPWMLALRRLPQPWWMRVVTGLRLTRLVRFVRRDTRFVPAAERVSEDDGLRMLVLAHRARRCGFRLDRLPARWSLQIDDVAFNALLVVSNRALREIAMAVGESIDDELADRFTATERALDELWDDRAGQYFSRDAQTGELIRVPTVATFLPLWSGVTSVAQTERLLTLLQDGSRFWPCWPVPSVPLDGPGFDPTRYWKGPTWVNMNWAIIQGLRAHGATELAAELRDRTLDLVARAGTSEYFSPLDGEGLGAEDFSWTAALTLDLLADDRA